MTYVLLILFVVFWLFILWRFYQVVEYFSERSFQRIQEIRRQRDS